jgi:hypothetical protein
MSVAAHVRRSQSTEPQKIDTKSFKLEFGDGRAGKGTAPGGGPRPLDPTTGLPMTDEKMEKLRADMMLAGVGAFPGGLTGGK